MVRGLVRVIGTFSGVFSCISAMNVTVSFTKRGLLSFSSSTIIVTFVVVVVLPYCGDVPFIS